MLKKRNKMGYGEDMNYQIVKSIKKMNSHSDKLFYEQLYLQKDPFWKNSLLPALLLQSLLLLSDTHYQVYVQPFLQ